jgi:predicted AlkP superfamily phosphohydrolase/phosphomutase
MLSNAVLAGGLAAWYLGVLLLQLNPGLVLRDPSALRLVGIWAVTYGIHLTVLFYALIVVRQMFSADVLSPGWLSLRLLSWLCAGSSAGAAVLMWLNLRGLRLALDEEAATRLTLGAAIVTACAVVFALLAILRSSLGRRGGSVTAVIFTITLIVAMAGPLTVRGWGHDRPLGSRRLAFDSVVFAPATSARVTMILIDGGSLDFISPAAADGRLPNFARLLEGGAAMHLATLRPTQPATTWAAVATGKLPPGNGLRSAATYRADPEGLAIDLLPDYCFAHALVYFDLLSETSQTSAALRARTLWSILSGAGIGSGIVRWPATYPAQPMRGVIVTDVLHRVRDSAFALDDPAVAYPEELGPALRSRMLAPPQASTMSAETAALTGPDYPGAAMLQLDELYARVFDDLRARTDLRLLAVRFQGLDAVGHLYLRQAMPRSFGDVSEDERRQFGRVVEQYYRYLDGEVGRAIESLAPGDLLLVVSAFGMEPLSLPKRLLERAFGNNELSGTHERAPDGFVLAFGRDVRRARLTRASLVDIAPTVLYFFGLPVGRDMDGYARTDLLTREFTEERPITFIPTYER